MLHLLSAPAFIEYFSLYHACIIFYVPLYITRWADYIFSILNRVTPRHASLAGAKAKLPMRMNMCTAIPRARHFVLPLAIYPLKAPGPALYISF